MVVCIHQQPVKVHCHVGSLESLDFDELLQQHVHCHVGSLEISKGDTTLFINVHCHVGSLEMNYFQ